MRLDVAVGVGQLARAGLVGDAERARVERPLADEPPELVVERGHEVLGRLPGLRFGVAHDDVDAQAVVEGAPRAPPRARGRRASARRWPPSARAHIR